MSESGNFSGFTLSCNGPILETSTHSKIYRLLLTDAREPYLELLPLVKLSPRPLEDSILNPLLKR